jgi:TonB family protein
MQAEMLFGSAALIALCAPTLWPQETQRPAPPSYCRHKTAESGSSRVVSFSGTVSRSEHFRCVFREGFSFDLMPVEYGWEIAVYEDGRPENLASLTPTKDGSNPRFIEGWQFLTAGNSDLNQEDVKGPQAKREFIFSPEIGRSIQLPATNRSPSEQDIERITHDGSGLFRIISVQPASLQPGQKAWLEQMSFDVSIHVGERTEIESIGPRKFYTPATVTAPEPIYKPDPVYPKEAQKKKIQGTVLLWIIVGQDGSVQDARVHTPLRPDLDAEALRTVRRWKFKPATRHGYPVAVQVAVEVEFRLYR